MSTTKWVLLKTSDGDRGENGKQKVYEVTVSPDGTVTFQWGMAEKSTRQTKKVYTGAEWRGRQEAIVQVNKKLDKGYRLAYTA